MTKINQIDYSGVKIQNMHELFDNFKEKEKGSFTSCIIAHDNYLPKDLFNSVKELLDVSCSNLVVYSKFREPLFELEKQLSENKLAVLVSVQELWT